MSDLFPERIETDRLVLEALVPDAVDPLTYYEHVSGASADGVTTHLPWDPHDHPRESLDVIRDAETARESGERDAAMLELAFDRPDLVAVPHVAATERSKRAVETYVDRFGGRHEGLLRDWQVNDDDESVADMHRYPVSRGAYAVARGDST